MELLGDTVLVVGGDGTSSTEAVLGEIDELRVETVELADPDAVGPALLADRGACPDPKWSDGVTGRTMTVGQIAQALAHYEAWRRIVASGRLAVVMEVGAEVGDRFERELDEIVAAMGIDRCHLTMVAGPGGPPAYVLTPEGASRLLVGAPLHALTPVTDSLRRVHPGAPTVDVVPVGGPVRSRHNGTSGDGFGTATGAATTAGLAAGAAAATAARVYTGHLVVLVVADDSPVDLGSTGNRDGALRAARSSAQHGLDVEIVDWLADGLASLDPHTMVLAVPETAVVAADAIDILAAYARHAGEIVLSVDEEAVLGPAGLLRTLLDDDGDAYGQGAGPAADSAADSDDADSAPDSAAVSAPDSAAGSGARPDSGDGDSAADSANAARPAGAAHLAPDEEATAGLAIDTVGAVFADIGEGRVIALNGKLLVPATGARPLVLTGSDSSTLSAVAADLRDPGSRDLARILRYDGAPDPNPRSGVVADDIVEIPFWTPAMCATVIRAAEAVGQWSIHEANHRRVGALVHDSLPAQEISLSAISPALYRHVEDHVGLRVWPVLRRHWPHAEYAGLQDALVVRLAPVGESAALPLRHDVAQVSGSVRLNADYVGGATEFPRQSFTDAQVPVGHVLAWPSLVTHPHGSSPPTSGLKYSLVIRCRIPGLGH